MKVSHMIYPLSAIRTLALHTQALTTPNGHELEITRDNMDTIAQQMAYVQIDTLHVVQRAHYLTMWSRFGNYDPLDFDNLSYDQTNRRWFEGWFHAACYLPLNDYRFRLARMRNQIENPAKWEINFLNEAGPTILDDVIQRIRDEGPLRVSDFEGDGRKRGAWWDWKPAKTALEILFHRGDLMIADRVKFHRVYDLRERVLPDWVDTTEASRADVMRYLVERLVKSAGASLPNQTMGRMMGRKRESQQVAQTLLDEGVFIEIQAQLADGNVHPLLVHRDNLPALQQAADGAIQPRRTTFINFFDNLFWEYGRDALFWNYRHMLEAYVPAAKRQWGYFCLDILHKDRFVGRFDPKVDRKKGILMLKALFLEPTVALDNELIADVAATMRDFMAFHHATELVIEQSQPPEFGTKLLKAI
jgi:hypothetical protein